MILKKANDEMEMDKRKRDALKEQMLKNKSEADKILREVQIKKA
jgi:hypothetical protein